MSQSIIQLPEKLEIVITTLCPLRCVTCPRGQAGYVPEAPHFMTVEEFKTILSRFPRLQVLQICGDAENTLNPHLCEMIEAAHEMGVEYIELFTSGVTLTKELAEKLAKTHLDMVKFSIDGATPETYRNIRGANHEQILANIGHFRTLTSIPFGVEVVVSSLNIHELEKFPEMAASIGASELELRSLSWGVELGDPLFVEEDDLQRAVEEVKENAGRLGIHVKYASPEEIQGEDCLIGDWINVDSFGRVTICFNRHRDTVGNLLDEPLEIIWERERLQEQRESYMRGEFHMNCCCPRAVHSRERVKI